MSTHAARPARYVMALDQGTTSCRALIIDHNHRVAAVAQREFRQSYPQPGWVEHDAEEIWTAQRAVMREALTHTAASADQIAAIGITNQRETVVVWDRRTGNPIHPAIVWQCRRTAAACDDLAAAGHGPMILEKTGLVIDAYFSASKVAWLLQHVPSARAAAERGELAMGTMDSWLIYKLTAGRLHVTDPSNASRTMLFNIHTRQWDDELLALFAIPRSLLPEVRPSSGVIGTSDPAVLGAAIPIAGIAGDQQSALFGQTCYTPGSAKNTYGTGCFLMMNTGHRPIRSHSRMLTTIAWDLGDGPTYALEGSIFVAGAVVQWLRDELGLISSAAETAYFAESIKSNGGVYFVPAFVGLGAPHWDPHARGTIVGLTRGSGKAHIIRAALESIAYRTREVVAALQSDLPEHPIAELRVDGGAAKNDFLMQFQADMLAIPVVRPANLETTAFGAAYLAGLATGYWQSPAQIAEHRSIDRRFEPSIDATQRAGLWQGWTAALARARTGSTADA